MNHDSGFWRLWDRHHVKAGWILLGLTMGLVAGTVAGTAVSCRGEGCTNSWDAVTAIGTWFGALGGLLAVGAAIATVRSSEKTRLEDARKAALTEQQRRDEAAAAARRVRFIWQKYVSSGDHMKSIRLVVVNDNTDTTVYRPKAVAPSLPRPVRTNPVAPGSSQQSTLDLPRPEDHKGGAYFERLRDETTFTYVIDNVTWQRIGTSDPDRVI